MDNMNGAIPDPRSLEEKNRDYPHDELLGHGLPDWKEKTEWVTLSLRKQISSSSCGGQAGAKLEEAFKWLVMSATPIYRRRTNWPDPGMYMHEIGDILKNKRTTTEALCPSQNMTEIEMNTSTIPKDLPYCISAYYTFPIKENLDMDLVAKALDQGHGLVVWINANVEEWGEVATTNGKPHTFSHFVACVPPNYLLYKGEKAIVIDDSCNAFSSIKGTGQRILTESFLKTHCWGILGLVPPLEELLLVKPSYHFSKDLSFGTKSKDVEVLQDILKYEDCMKKEVPSTGYFGPITKAAVIKLQNKHKDLILTPAELTQGTGYVGNFTRMYLNEKYK